MSRLTADDIRDLNRWALVFLPSATVARHQALLFREADEVTDRAIRRHQGYAVREATERLRR